MRSARSGAPRFLKLPASISSSVIPFRTSRGFLESGRRTSADNLGMGIVILAILLASSPGSPQSATSNRARFEAASVKRCSSDGAAPPEAEGGRGRGGPAPADPGGLRIECRTVEDFIRIAYLWFPDGQGRPAPRSQESDPIRGAPPWTRSERYTIEAKPDGAQSSGMMRGPTLQTLLEERFALKVHREAREVPAYALAVDKGGPKLQPSKGLHPQRPCPGGRSGRRGTASTLRLSGLLRGRNEHVRLDDGVPLPQVGKQAAPRSHR